MPALTSVIAQAGTAPFEGAGEMAALAGAFAWGTASVLYARSMRGSDALGAVWFKNSIAALALGVIALVVGFERGGGLPGEGETLWLVLSGLTAMCIGDWLYFVAITHIGIGRTVIITLSTPALTALLAWPLYGQTLAAGQWFGVALVVSGGMFAESRRIRPGTAEAIRKTDRTGVYVAVLCAFLWTAGNLIIHKGLHETGAITGGAVRLAAGAAGFALWFLFRGELPARLRQLTSADSWRRYGFATVLGTVFGMWMYVGAFKWAKQGVAASLSSAVPLFAIPLSVWILGEKPGLRGWLGAAVVMTGVCFVSQLLGA